jgi:2-polyprenyl-3-methyl-5-hydroxy-6-metoxy-1,4-benzoquinol methylase
METDRLGQHVFQLEKIRTQEIILRYLKPSMTIADIGGATGAYSFWLHDMGHKVHLLDAAEFHIEAATKSSITENKPLGIDFIGRCKRTSL